MSDSRPVVLHARVVTGRGGGPEKTILSNARFLAPYGYQCLSVYMHPPGDPGFEEIRCRAAACEAPLVGIEDRGPCDLRVLRQLFAVCRERHVAIWHGHDYKSNVLGLLLKRFHPMKLVSTVHGWGVTGGRAPLYYRIDRRALRHYDRILCVADELRERCLASGVPADRCQVLENGIDLHQFTRHGAPADAKGRLGFDPARFLIGAVGRLSPEKDFASLVRAAAELLTAGRNLTLAIVGEGEERGALQRLVAQSGHSDHIHLLGYRSDTIDLYQAMDALVLSSLREGLPNVLLEAMAMEVPVVATRIAGVPRLVDGERNGLLVEPGNPAALRDAMARLMDHQPLRRRLAEAGRATVEQRYSLARRMERIHAVYQTLLGSQSPHG